jgi:hypothetical protein
MKIASWLMLTFFIAAVALQYNDPDPALWISIYALSAVSTALFLLNKSIWKYISIAPVLISIYELTFYIQASLHSEYLGVHPAEFYSEFGGLCIVLIWIILLQKLFGFKFTKHREEAT